MAMKLDMRWNFFYVGWPRRGPGQKFSDTNADAHLYSVANLVDIATATAIFSYPVYFASPLKGFPLELDIGAWGQKTVMGYRAEQ